MTPQKGHSLPTLLQIPHARFIAMLTYKAELVGSRRYKHLSQVYKRVSQQKRNKQNDSLHKASHLIAHKLVERTVCAASAFAK